MRHARCICLWEVIALAGSLALLFSTVVVFVRDPDIFNFTEPEQLTCHSSRPCIRKCCPQGEELQQPSRNETSGCYPTNTSHFSLSDIPQANNGSKWDVDRFHTIYKNCQKYNPDDGETVLLLENGRVKVNETELTLPGYCIDFKIDKTYVFLCFIEEEETHRSLVFGWMVSASFLFLTAVVYGVISTNSTARQRLQISPTHMKIVLNYLPTLMIGYCLLSIINKNPFRLNTDYPCECRLIAFIVQFSFLASFFWLNVMCFDIWLVFSNLKPVQGRKHKKFLFYSLYAWGVPFVIVAISVAMDMIPGVPDSFIKPRFGVTKCWFADQKGTLLYFYLPIAVVVVLNIIMFVSTAIKLRAHTQSAKVLKTSESRTTNENDRDRFNLYLKLFIIMGINWVMELVSFFVGGPKSLWFVTDLGNTLQGVLIFVIFVCKRRILRLLNEKLCPRWQIIQDNSNSGRSKVSSTRTNSSTLSKTVSENQDNLSLKPIARAHDENDE